MWWVLNGNGFKIQGESKQRGKMPMVVDSGTSLIIGPSSMLNDITSKIQVAEDCSNVDQLPTVTFYIDGRAYPLTSREYVLPVHYFGQTFCIMGI